jgi:hypothetical protein
VSSAITIGTYSVGTDCSATATLTDQRGNIRHYILEIAEDGGVVLFNRINPTTVVSGIALPQFAAPQQALVNGASFAARRMAPGSLFSIFGGGFSQQTTSATTLPRPI